MTDAPPAQDLLASARAEAMRMRAAVDGLAADGTVRLRRDHFAKLAALIEMLVARGAGGAEGSFDTPVDGVRWWVPLPEVERDRAELATLRSYKRAVDVEALLARATS